MRIRSKKQRPFILSFLLYVVAMLNPAYGQNTSNENVIGELPLEELRMFADAFNQIRLSYVEEVDDKTLLEHAIRGMLTGLDPHSNYLDAKDFNDLQENTSGEFGGLGLEVGMEDGFIKVIAAMDDTPAQKAGMESGDLIIKLDGKPVKGLSLNESVKKMRGKKGSSITLTVAREGLEKPLDITLVRSTIKIRSVRSKTLEDGYGYIRIAQFQKRTGADVRNALVKLQQKNVNLKGLVIDLRNNPGGVLGASVEVAETFLKNGTVVYTQGRVANAKATYSANSEDSSKGTPIVVLINGGSASASEIVAGALQDHRRAIIMGTDSFGKGSVQTVLPLSNQVAIKLTTARYYTPNGRSIQAQGISPDIIVERAKLETLEYSGRISEKDLNKHLANEDSKDKKKARAFKQSKQLYETDNQLYEALNLLKGIHILSENKSNNNSVANPAT